jgi:trans-aconitate 2-methyltransferase
MIWNPSTYLAFGNERTRPAIELASRVNVAEPDVVVDLGCGPGNSTAILAQRWPNARFIGVDNSAEMLATARETPLNAEWQLADLASWSSPSPVPVIFSNAAYQWIDNHAAIVPRLMSSLAPKGVLAIQMPRNFDAPSHVLLRDIATNGPWAAKVARFNRVKPVAEPSAYYAMLSPHASALDIWETEYLQALDGEDAVFKWVSGTALVPYREALDEAERKQFLNAYRERLARAYPRGANGKTLFPFKRIFIVAQR